MGLSLQPQAVICPKCQYKRTADDHGPAWQCPNCGIAYNKATAPSPAVTHIVNSASRERGVRNEFATATPSAFSLSTDGRIGRLRYLAFGWPIIASAYVLGLLAAVIMPRHEVPGVIFVILFLVLLFWMPLRLVALRLHDVNRSGKWAPTLLLLPITIGVLGGLKMAPVGAWLFWIVALLLLFVPGSDGDNDYGPQPGPNTILVKVGAGLFVALMALAVFANIKYTQYARSHQLQGTAQSLGTAPGP